MEVRIDESYKKVITIPLEFAHRDAKQYQYLHQKTIPECFELEEIEDVDIFGIMDICGGIFYTFFPSGHLWSCLFFHKSYFSSIKFHL